MGMRAVHSIVRAMAGCGAVAALLVAGMPAVGADPLPPCATPEAHAYPWAAGSENKVSWTMSGTEGSGFIAEVALTPDFAQIEQSFGNVSADARSFHFTGLSEAQHYYRVRTKALSGVCAASDWSAPVTTTQDATPPVVTITEPLDGQPETGSTITVAGTLTDPPGGGAPSGPHHVVAVLTNTLTNNIKYGYDDRSAWSMTFPNLDRGVYTVAVRGVDNAGNVTVAPTRHAVVSGLLDAPPHVGGPPSLVGDFEGQFYGPAAPGSFESTDFTEVQFDVTGTYAGQPVSTGYFCQPDSDTGWTMKCDIFTQVDGVNSVNGSLPTTFTALFQASVASPTPAAAGTFTATATLFDGLQLSCSGPASPELGYGGLFPDPQGLWPRWGGYGACTIS